MRWQALCMAGGGGLMGLKTAQNFIAGVGRLGTLSAAVVTQVLANRAERVRRGQEDESRWLGERLRANREFLGGALSLERDLWSAASMLDNDSRTSRLPGYTSILLVPEEGLD